MCPPFLTVLAGGIVLWNIFCAVDTHFTSCLQSEDESGQLGVWSMEWAENLGLFWTGALLQSSWL